MSPAFTHALAFCAGFAACLFLEALVRFIRMVL